jgi:hypothetical protein
VKISVESKEEEKTKVISVEHKAERERKDKSEKKRRALSVKRKEERGGKDKRQKYKDKSENKR